MKTININKVIVGFDDKPAVDDKGSAFTVTLPIWP